MVQISMDKKLPGQQILQRFSRFTADDSYFISFEGIEGAGKSTQIQRFQELIESQGFKTLLVREPGGTIFGEKLREAILQSECPLDPIAEAHLFASSRAQLLFEKSLKHLEKSKTVVIYDRYIDSSLAYQGIARGLGIDTILEIHSHYPLTTLPTLTFYIKISLECSLERQALRNQQKDYFESETKNFYAQLINGYNQAASIFPQRFATIDGERDVDNVFKQIEQSWNRLIGQKK